MHGLFIMSLFTNLIGVLLKKEWDKDIMIYAQFKILL